MLINKVTSRGPKHRENSIAIPVNDLIWDTENAAPPTTANKVMTNERDFICFPSVY